MQSRKNVYKLIAARYGLGFAEINNTNNIFLISSYLPNHPESTEKKPELPSISILVYDPLYYGQLKVSGSYSGEGPLHLSSRLSEDLLTVEQINSIIAEMDKQFKPLESKQDDPQIANQNLIIFSNYQVGLKSPITNNKILWDSFYTKGQLGRDSEYGVTLDFLNSTHLQRFLSGISEEAQKAAKPEIYAIYECSYGLGCYQIVIPHGQEYQALALLFGANEFTANLPITHYLKESLKPKPFLSNPFSKSFTDEQFSAAMSIMMKVFQGKVELNDFEEPVKRVILSNSNLKHAFLATVEVCKKYDAVEVDIKTIMPASLAAIVMDYYRETPKFK